MNDGKITVKVDGREVELTEAEVASYVKAAKERKPSALPESYYLGKFGANGEEGGAGALTLDAEGTPIGFIVAGTQKRVQDGKKLGFEIQCTSHEGERWDPIAKRWNAPEGSERCTASRDVATSDLHQTQTCQLHGVLRQRAKGKARRALEKAALEALKARGEG